MAFRNLIKKDTYAVLTICEYDKTSRNLVANLIIRPHKDTHEVMGMIQIRKGANEILKEVEALDVESVDRETQFGKWFATAPGVSGDSKVLLRYETAESRLETGALAEGVLVKVASTGKVYRYDGAEWEEDPDILTQDRWDALFGVDVLTADGENLIKRLYEVLAKEWELEEDQNV